MQVFVFLLAGQRSVNFYFTYIELLSLLFRYKNK